MFHWGMLFVIGGHVMGLLIPIGVYQAFGASQTVISNNVFGPYEYRLTVGPWIRGLILFHPDIQLMTHVPLLLQIHIILSFSLFAVSPFTRLVHVWSAPIRYPKQGSNSVSFTLRNVHESKIPSSKF